MTPHFTARELQCKCGCGLARFHPGFLDDLESLRVEFGRPMRVNSACRCKAHNGAVKGHARSLHIGDEMVQPTQRGALAVDIATPSGLYRGELFALGWDEGWSIGWNAARGFLHLDRRNYVGLSQTSFDY
jgi:hypothetical protein